MDGTLLAAASAIGAAVIAGSFSYLSLITSKEQKVSEFRQAWIDKLRTSISEYISALSYISILYKHWSDKPDSDRDKFQMATGVGDTYNKVNASYNDIIFRINEHETDEVGKKLNNELLSALKETRSLYNSSDYFKALDKCDGVRDATKPLLKYEWERVKKGEPAYRRAKWVALIVLSLGLFFSVGSLGLAFSSKGKVSERGNNGTEVSLPRPPNQSAQQDASKASAAD